MDLKCPAVDISKVLSRPNSNEFTPVLIALRLFRKKNLQNHITVRKAEEDFPLKTANCGSNHFDIRYTLFMKGLSLPTKDQVLHRKTCPPFLHMTQKKRWIQSSSFKPLTGDVNQYSKPWGMGLIERWQKLIPCQKHWTYGSGKTVQWEIPQKKIIRRSFQPSFLFEGLS